MVIVDYLLKLNINLLSTVQEKLWRQKSLVNKDCRKLKRKNLGKFKSICNTGCPIFLNANRWIRIWSPMEQRLLNTIENPSPTPQGTIYLPTNRAYAACTVRRH